MNNKKIEKHKKKMMTSANNQNLIKADEKEKK